MSSFVVYNHYIQKYIHAFSIVILWWCHIYTLKWNTAALCRINWKHTDTHLTLPGGSSEAPNCTSAHFHFWGFWKINHYMPHFNALREQHATARKPEPK